MVFAHEIGHHVHRHLPKLVALSGVLALAGFWLVDVVGSTLAPRLGYESFTDTAAMPLVLVLLRSLDWRSVRCSTRSAGTLSGSATAMPWSERTSRTPTGRRSSSLALLNKTDPDPPSLVVWLFHDHPPIRERLAMASDDKVTG